MYNSYLDDSWHASSMVSKVGRGSNPRTSVHSLNKNATTLHDHLLGKPADQVLEFCLDLLMLENNIETERWSSK